MTMYPPKKDNKTRIEDLEVEMARIRGEYRSFSELVEVLIDDIKGYRAELDELKNAKEQTKK